MRPAFISMYENAQTALEARQMMRLCVPT
jgi:hypothetical protein